MLGDSRGGPIRWRIPLGVAPERAFAAPDANDGRAACWADSAIERDGAVAFCFSNGFVCTWPIVEREAPRILALDYIGGGVCFERADDGAGGTDLRLTHLGVADREWNDVHAGWLNVLFLLKA